MEVDDSSITPSVVSTLSSAAAAAAGNDCTVNSSSDNSITITKATTTTSSAIDSTATKSSNSTIEPQPMDDDGGGSTTTATTTTTTTTTSSSSSSGISIAQSSSETAMSSSVGNNKEDKTDMIITSTVDLPSTTTTTITTATKLTPSQSNEKETLTATTSFNDNDELLMNVTEKELDGSSSVVDDGVSTSISKDNGIHSTEKLEIMNTEVAEDELNDMAKDILEGCTSGTGLEKADVKEKLPDNVVKAKTATKTMPPIIKVDSTIEQTNLPSKSSTAAINNDQKHQSKETAFMDDIDGDDDLIMKLEEIEGTSTISTTTKNSGTKEISNIDNKTTSTAATTATTTTTTTTNKNTIDSNVLKNLGGILEKNEETDYSKGNSRDTDDLLKDLECDDDNIISSLTKNNTTIVQTIDDQKKINKTVNNIDEQLINKNISVRQTDKTPKSNENISTITNEIKLNANQQVNNQSSSSSSSSMVVTKAAKNKDNNINKYNSIEHDDNDIVKELNATVPNTIKKVNQTNNSSSSNNTNNCGVEETVDSTQNSKSITLKRKRSVDDDEDLTISTNDVKIQKVGTTTPKAKCELMDVTVVDDDEQKIALNKKQDESIISSSTSSTPGDPKKSPETNLPIKIDLKHTKMVEIKFKSGKDSSETTKHETIKVQSSKISPNKTTQQQQPTNNSKSPIDNQKTNTNKNKTNPLIKINVAASTTISKPIQPVKQSDQQQQPPQLSKEIGNRTQVIPPKKVKIDIDKKKSDGSGVVDTSKTVIAQQKPSDSTNITITKTITSSNDSNKVKDSVKASSSDNNSVNSEILRIPEVESINSKPRIKNTGSISSSSSSTTTTTSISQQKKQQSKDISSNKISCENNCITKDTATTNESKQQLPLSKYPIESHNGLSLSNATTEAEDAEDIEMEDKTTSTNDNAKKEKKQTTPIKSSSGSPSLDKENTNVNKTNISNPTISNANNLIYEINIDNDHGDDDNDHHYLNIMTIKRIMDEEKSQSQELNTTDSVTKTDAQKTNLMESKQIKETFKGIPAVCNWIIDYFTKLKHSCGADGGGGGGNVDKVDDAKSTPKSNKNISTPKTTATKKQATTKTVKQQSGKKPGNKRKLNKNDEDNHENDNTTTTTATTTTTTTNITTAASDEPKPKKSHQQKLSMMNSSVESLNNSMDNINNGKQQQLLQSAMTIPSDAKCCLAKWVDKKFYAAKVIGENGFKKYSIRFEDGIKKVLPDESVIIGMDDTGILPLLNEEIHALIDKETYEPGIVLECTKSVDDPNQIIYKVACATVTVSVTSAEIYLEDAQAKLIKKNIQKKQLAEESTTTTINSMGETTTINNTTITNTTTATSTPDKIQQLSPQIEPRRSAGRPAKYNPQLFVKTVDRGSSSPKITTPTSTVKRGRKSNKDKLAAAVAAATAAAEAEEQQKLITTNDVSSSPLVTGDSTTTAATSTDVNSIGDAAPAVVISDNTPEKNRRGKSENITNKTTAAATSTTTPSPSSTTTTVTTNI